MEKNKQQLIDDYVQRQQQFYKEFAKDYLTFLGNPNPTLKQIKEIQILLSQAWIQRTICLDERLTPRERQCLYLSALGKNIKAISSFLKVTERQVERQRNSIFQKLGCSNIAQAIAQGLRYGEIGLPPDLPIE